MSPIIAESGTLPEASSFPKWRGLYAGHQQMSANFYALPELFCDGPGDLDTAIKRRYRQFAPVTIAPQNRWATNRSTIRLYRDRRGTKSTIKNPARWQPGSKLLLCHDQ